MTTQINNNKKMKPINTVLNFMKVQSILNKKFDALSLHGLSLTDYMILHILNDAEGGRLKRIDLAERIGLTASGITRVIIPLEKIGLVAKESSDRDARVSYVKLVASGKRVFEEANITANHISEKLLESLDVEDLALFNKQLKRLGGDL